MSDRSRAVRSGLSEQGPKANRTGTLNVRASNKECTICGRRFSSDAAFCPFDGVPLASAAAIPGRDSLVGTSVDARYDVLGVLGEGGMGRVYRVRHSALNRAFAMKVLRSDLAADAGLAERFIQEARATASIRHPSVVQITDFGRLPRGVPYFVMEYLVGQTLWHAMKGEALPPSPAALVAMLVHLARGVGAAHAAGVIHRDLKPDNVFLLRGTDLRGPALAQASDVRICDFGAAKIVGASRITRQGVVFGTPHYMSPEQASGQPIDHRADIYAIGVILYELLTGRLPFVAETYMGVLTQHVYAQPVAPSELCPSLDALRSLEPIALRCLAKRPSDRFASMDELAAALEATEPSRSRPQAPVAGRPAVLAGRPRSGVHAAARRLLRPRSMQARKCAGLAIAFGLLMASAMAAALATIVPASSRSRRATVIAAQDGMQPPLSRAPVRPISTAEGSTGRADLPAPAPERSASRPVQRPEPPPVHKRKAAVEPRPETLEREAAPQTSPAYDEIDDPFTSTTH